MKLYRVILLNAQNVKLLNVVSIAFKNGKDKKEACSNALPTEQINHLDD